MERTKDTGKSWEEVEDLSIIDMISEVIPPSLLNSVALAVCEK